MIDEPRWWIVGDWRCFGRICESLASSTSLFDGVLSVQTVRAESARAGRMLAPNFLRMERATALETARRTGTNVLCDGDAGRVVAQAPAPGARMNKNDVIRLVVSNGTRADLYMNQRLREGYRAANPTTQNDEDEKASEGVTVGVGTSAPRLPW